MRFDYTRLFSIRPDEHRATRPALVPLNTKEFAYEPFPPPSQPGLGPDAIGHHPALLDGHSHDRINFLSELLFMGRLGRRIVLELHRCGNMGENKERVINFLPTLT